MIDETPVQLDQIETWQQALEEGRSLLAVATQLQAAAKQAQQLRHWDEAAAQFRQARSRYETAQGCLAIPAAIDAGAYRALRALRDQASELHKQAHAALAEHARARWIEMCEQNISMALDMQQQAQAALHDGNLAAARALASQAHEMHPALREQAERTMRAAGERAGEQGSLISKIVMVLLVAVLLGLIIGVGPQLWQWVAG
jgi:hypothetical protein